MVQTGPVKPVPYLVLPNFFERFFPVEGSPILLSGDLHLEKSFPGFCFKTLKNRKAVVHQLYLTFFLCVSVALMTAASYPRGQLLPVRGKL